MIYLLVCLIIGLVALLVGYRDLVSRVEKLEDQSRNTKTWQKIRQQQAHIVKQRFDDHLKQTKQSKRKVKEKTKTEDSSAPPREPPILNTQIPPIPPNKIRKNPHKIEYPTK